MIPTKPKKTWAIYGGSFNPVHFGHLFVMEYLANMKGINGVLVVPTFKHPDGKKLVDFQDRVAMLEAETHNKEGVYVSRLEQELGGISYSLRTVQTLVKDFPEYNFRFVVGSDCVMNKHTWGEDWNTINELAPMFVIGRAGCEVDGVPTMMPSISSTQVREHIKAGNWEEAQKLLPKTTLNYIQMHGLYV